MLLKKILLLSPLPIVILLILVLLTKPQQAYAYGNGNCADQINGSPDDICYTGKQGPDVAPGYTCGDRTDYVYVQESESIYKGGIQFGDPGHIILCSSGGGLPDGFCCAPTSSSVTPYPALPDHSKPEGGYYDLGGDCQNYTSICYDHGDQIDKTRDSLGNIYTGEQCADLPGWHYGTDHSGGVPKCGAGGGGVCCDPGPGFVTPSPPNPCPHAPTPGVCMSVDTAIGPIDVSGPGGFIRTVFGVLLSIAGGTALILIIFSGYRIMASQGDPEKVKGAREMLVSAIIGLLFMIFSVTILQILGVDILHIPGFSK